MKTLSSGERALYRKLLRRKMTIPGFLPVGDGLANGLWEDVIVFDPNTWRRIAFPIIESWTNAPCDRGRTIEYNLRFAGLTERAMHPEEFRGEIMAFKKKMAKEWAKKKPLLRLKPDGPVTRGVKARGGRMILTGLNPLKLVREHPVERMLYRTGLYLRRFPGDKSNSLSIVLPVNELSLDAVKRYRANIVNWCLAYSAVPAVKREIFIPFSKADKPKALSDLQCLRLYRRLSRKRNTHSNQVLLTLKGVK